jgi:hypothetical protein
MLDPLCRCIVNSHLCDQGPIQSSPVYIITSDLNMLHCCLALSSTLERALYIHNCFALALFWSCLVSFQSSKPAPYSGAWLVPVFQIRYAFCVRAGSGWAVCWNLSWFRLSRMPEPELVPVTFWATSGLGSITGNGKGMYHYLYNSALVEEYDRHH